MTKYPHVAVVILHHKILGRMTTKALRISGHLRVRNGQYTLARAHRHPVQLQL
jgi:hypothetical protein